MYYGLLKLIKKIAELCENYLPGTLLLPQDPSLDSVILWVFFQTKEKEKLIFFVVKWFVFNIKITETWVFLYIVLDKVVLIRND